MCGIFGAVSKKSQVLPWLVGALRRLEYRGYDSSGIAIYKSGKIFVHKKTGDVSRMNILPAHFNRGVIRAGIAHNRWATHGNVSRVNAHPHQDDQGLIAVVHNGIIDNFLSLRTDLIGKGHRFVSQTDSEVIPHLLQEHFRGDFLEAIHRTVDSLVGSFALAIITSHVPETIFCLRNESSLVIGKNTQGSFCSSDIAAMAGHTKEVTLLENGEIAILNKHGFSIVNQRGKKVKRRPFRADIDDESVSKKKFKHFMLKEIYEQPITLMNTFSGRIDSSAGRVELPEIDGLKKDLAKLKRIIIVGCGTSWHAGLVGEYMLEGIARLSVEVEYASEFRYRHPIIHPGEDLVIGISQSGETSDTLAALRESKKCGARILSICNVINSTMAREADYNIYIKAGTEIGVASTKAFLSQIGILFLLACHIGCLRRGKKSSYTRRLLREALKIPLKAEEILRDGRKIAKVAGKYFRASNMMYMGRGEGYPIALEGALKIKEISYIHAEGYPAAEMKHGPIALIDKGMPSIIIALEGRRYEKILGNIQEIKSRKGKVIAIATKGDESIGKIVDDVLYIPQTLPELTALLAVIPLQLFAYFVADKRGCDIDKPKNLAKSVTVE